jgi:hypothetical protein
VEHTLNGTILVDVSPGADGTFTTSFLGKVGHPVLVCHGPHEGEVCPLLAGKGCERYEEAHGIVFDLDLDVPQHREILRRYRSLRREDLPIHVVTTDEKAQLHRDVLTDVEVWTHEPTAADLDAFAAEVEAADR